MYLGALASLAASYYRCSWENYSICVGLIGELREWLADSLNVEVTLLDAHSFAWILASQMEGENRLANVTEYLNLSASERDAIIKARKGQGRFRQYLMDYWSCRFREVSACSMVGEE